MPTVNHSLPGPTPQNLSPATNINAAAPKSTSAHNGKLLNKVIVITDGDTPLARVVAGLLAREGAHIAIVYSGDKAAAGKAIEEVEKAGRHSLLIKGKMETSCDGKKMIDHVMQKFGQLNVLINHINLALGEDIFSCLPVAKAALHYMKSGSCIINSISLMQRDLLRLPDLLMEKNNLLHFNNSLRRLQAHASVRINGISPLIYYDESRHSQGSKNISDKLNVNEIATLFLYLACSDGALVNDQIIYPHNPEAIMQGEDIISDIAKADVLKIIAPAQKNRAPLVTPPAPVLLHAG